MHATDTKRDGLVLGMSDEEYHGGTELSSTGVKQLAKSAAHFRAYQTGPRRESKAFDVGHAVHARVLGTGLNAAPIPGELLASNGYASTKEAKAWIAEARLNGLVPVKQVEYDQIVAMSDAVLAHKRARILFEQEGHAEASLFATDPETGIRMRARYDYLAECPVDLKTTTGEATYTGMQWRIADYSYDLQDVFYGNVHELVTGYRRDMTFVFVEAARPHLVGIAQIDDEWRDMAVVKVRAALRLYELSLERDKWPGYPLETQLLHPPARLINDFIDRYEK